MMAVTFSASAQDKEGLIPKIWKRFKAKKDSTQASPASPAVSEQREPPAALKESAPTMTKEEMIRGIKDAVETDDGIMENISELKRCKDEDGKEFYAYSDGKDEIRLEDIDMDRLKRLMDKVYTQMNTDQANTVKQQVDVITEIQSETNLMMQRMKTITESQRVSSAQQQMPRTPPPQPQRISSPPPQPPRR